MGLSKCGFGDWKQLQGKYPVPVETLKHWKVRGCCSLRVYLACPQTSNCKPRSTCAKQQYIWNNKGMRGFFSFRCIIVHAVFQKRRYIKSTRKSNFEDLKQSQPSIQRKRTNTFEIPKRYADVLFVCIFVQSFRNGFIRMDWSLKIETYSKWKTRNVVDRLKRYMNVLLSFVRLYLHKIF